MNAGAHLSIGGLHVALTGGDTLRRAAALPGMAVFRTGDSGRVDMRLALDQAAETVECRWLSHFPLADGACECRQGVDAAGALHYRFSSGCEVVWHPDRPDLVELGPCADMAILRFVLWTAYGLAALPLGAVPVHASTVVCDGRAVLCLGESGTGKSTHTRLWLQHIEGSRLLNDDSPILRVEADSVAAYGSPWSGKTPCYRQERFPVAALLRLRQAPHNSIERLRVLQSFAALQPSCPPEMMHFGPTQDMLVDFVGRVIERVPVYRMDCLPDADAARVSHNAIFH